MDLAAELTAQLVEAAGRVVRAHTDQDEDQAARSLTDTTAPLTATLTVEVDGISTGPVWETVSEPGDTLHRLAYLLAAATTIGTPGELVEYRAEPGTLDVAQRALHNAPTTVTAVLRIRGDHLPTELMWGVAGMPGYELPGLAGALAYRVANRVVV